MKKIIQSKYFHINNLILILLITLLSCAGNERTKPLFPTLKYDAKQPVLVFYLPFSDCVSCMYASSNLVHNVLEKNHLPKENIVFLLNDVRKKEAFRFCKETYNIDLKQYNFLCSDETIEYLYDYYGKKIQGASIFVIDIHKKLLFYERIKQIYDAQTVLRILSQ